MAERVERARLESDTAYFYDLLAYGEMVTKLVTAAMVATLPVEPEGHRYRLEYGLVRSDGLGDWVEALDDVLTGPASQYLAETARVEQTALTKMWATDEDAWQYHAVALLDQACRTLDPSIKTARKVQLRSWFHRFVWLRNKTRGHGAPTGAKCSDMAPSLAAAIDELVANLPVFARSWAVIRRNLSGRYRVGALAGDRAEFSHLTRNDQYSYPDGVYLVVDGLNRVALVSTDVDLLDFFIANGGFTGDHHEMLSYVTDEHTYPSNEAYLRPPAPLPASETQGLAKLDLLGKSFANLPPRTRDYVQRQLLETELRERLTDERHPVITLIGIGGAGKTSVALQVLHSLAEDGRFFAVVWFSARDIDLLSYGPKQVKPHVLASKEISEEFARLISPEGYGEKTFDTTAYLSESLSGATGLGPVLFVFDNFETLRSPGETFRWLDQSVRLPNKVLVTTRMREFKGDYPVEVRGMTQAEFQELVQSTAARLGILDRITPGYVDRLFVETEGHPYVTKILLGEVAASGIAGAAPRILAAKENVLEALFERTYAGLVPASQRVFLLLSTWRSVVPVAALKAALLRPVNERIDVELVLDQLGQSSLIDVSTSDVDGERFVSVPLAASLFGRKKLIVSPMKSAVEADTEILRLFGATQPTDIRHGLAPRVESLFRAAADRLQKGDEELTELLPVLELVAQGYPPARLRLADFFLERGDLNAAIEATRRFLQERPTDAEAWRKLAQLSKRSGDYLGEMHALLELARFPATPFGEVSDSANRFNLLLREHVIDVQSDEKRVMADRLRKVMESRVPEANATDLSRLGWLCVHLRDLDSARRYAQRGLVLEPSNYHCNRLANIQEWR
jgi:hypothetical protein